jgi:hypothetical protein
MKFTAPIDEDPIPIRNHVSPSMLGYEIPKHHPVRNDIFRIDSAPSTNNVLSIERIKAKLKQRKDHLNEFLFAPLSSVQQISPDKLTYKKDAEHIMGELMSQTVERESYMNSIEELINKRSTLATTQLSDFRKKQKELEESKIKALIEKQKQQELELKRVQEEEKSAQRKEHELLLTEKKMGISELKRPESIYPYEISDQQKSLTRDEKFEIKSNEGPLDQKEMEVRKSQDSVNIYTSEEISKRVANYNLILKVY